MFASKTAKTSLIQESIATATGRSGHAAPTRWSKSKSEGQNSAAEGRLTNDIRRPGKFDQPTGDDSPDMSTKSAPRFANFASIPTFSAPKSPESSTSPYLPLLRFTLPTSSNLRIADSYGFLEREADDSGRRMGLNVHRIRPATPPSTVVSSLNKRNTENGRPMMEMTGADVPESVSETLRSTGQGLAESAISTFAPQFGPDLSAVRLHTDEVARRSARELNALAYTVGNHIAFDSDRVQPYSSEGYRLMAHELTHVVQQSRMQPLVQRKPRKDLDFEDSESAARYRGQVMAKRIKSHTKLSKEARKKFTEEKEYFKGKARVAYLEEVKPALIAVKEVELAADEAHSKDKSTATALTKANQQSMVSPDAFFDRMLANPKYIDNEMKEVNYFSGELAVVHYRDGSTLELGLIAKWMKPPFVEVNYHTSKEEFRPMVDSDGQFSFFLESELKSVPPNMPWSEVQMHYARPVAFLAHGTSGRIVPSRVNALTAPKLCQILLDSEGKAEEQIQLWITLALGILDVMKLQTLNPLFGGGAAWSTGAAAATKAGITEGEEAVAATSAKVASRAMTPGQMGKILGWGGRTAAGVAKTEAVTASLTTQTVKKLIAEGVTKELVQEQLELYTSSLAKGGAKLKNMQLLPRLKLMTRLLELWPK